MKSRFVLLTLLSFMAVSCGNEKSSPGNGAIPIRSIDGKEYGVLKGADTLQSQSNLIQGTGEVVFANPLGEVASGTGFDIRFSIEDGGSLSLVAYSDNKLSNGYQIRFLREGQTLKGEVIAQGKTNPIRIGLEKIDASATLSFAIDIHNDETPVHFLLWSGDDFGVDKAIVNSGALPWLMQKLSPGNGSGTFYGLALDKATVTSIKTGEVKFEH